jgi:hypothetical protein
VNTAPKKVPKGNTIIIMILYSNTLNIRSTSERRLIVGGAEILAPQIINMYKHIEGNTISKDLFKKILRVELRS